MKKSLLTAILLFVSLFVIAQRTLPYPIILVHGWTGSYTTWEPFSDYLYYQANLSVAKSSLSFDLNCDGDVSKSNLKSDVCNFTVENPGNHDVYVVDFKFRYDKKTPNTPYSNEAGIVKQGYAIKLAIQTVLAATKADKVVLLGHSMGGLAIREYLQNSSNWQSDGQHHVAKLITIGTPHEGSNLGSGDLNIYSRFTDGGEERSEAVRDLRTSYKTLHDGVYLYGGYETSTYIQRGFGSSYFNLDVNCNGQSGDLIVGLNQKSIRNDLDFACIIGGPNFSDAVVTVESQNLNTRYPTLKIDLFYHNCNPNLFETCHVREPREAIFPMMYALDEPKKYPANIKFDTSYKGFFTNQADGTYIDTDTYVLNCSSKGTMKISCGTATSANGRITVRNYAGAQIADFAIGSGVNQSIEIPYAGEYSIYFTGNSNNGWATYNYSASFCSMPEIPTILASGSTSFCEGQSVTLSTTASYDRYRWYKDNVEINGTGNSIVANQSGVFTVQGFKCDRWTSSSNNVGVTVRPAPAKPTIAKEDQPNQFVLTASSAENYQWLLNGNPINGTTTQTYLPQELGNYAVKVAKNDCVSQSDAVSVTMGKPVLVLNGSNPICDGESTALVAPSGFGQYKWVKDQTETLTDKRELAVTKGGSYRVATQRGKFVSEWSDPIAVTVNPKPAKPTISVESSGLKSSSANNNQWYADGMMIKEATGQTLANIGAGRYVVRVTELGCYSESEPFVITAIEPTEASFSVKLYPNPNEGTFWVELPDTLKEWEVAVFDTQGKRILQQKHSRSPINRERINLKVTTGTYLLKVMADDRVQQVKFTIE
jgi:pimeloyl-ACP methyl ester carboxylesterase